MGREVIDLQIPRPLLSPDEWRRPSGGTDERQAVWVSTLAMSGPMARLRNEMIQVWDALSISVPTDLFSKVVCAEASWSPLIETELKALIGFRSNTKIEIVSDQLLSSFEKTHWGELLRRAGLASQLSFKIQPELKPPSLYDWSVEVFPKSFLKLGELVWRRELENYRAQLAPTFASMSHLRFWPGHLRRKGLDVAPLANYELSVAEALFSPQEDRQGSGPNALLNPTLQVADVLAIWRLDSILYERELHWQEAATIDELRENPRLSFAALETELESQAFPFKDGTRFLEVIEKLTNEGLILRR